MVVNIISAGGNRPLLINLYPESRFLWMFNFDFLRIEPRSTEPGMAEVSHRSAKFSSRHISTARGLSINKDLKSERRDI